MTTPSDPGPAQNEAASRKGGTRWWLWAIGLAWGAVLVAGLYGAATKVVPGLMHKMQYTPKEIGPEERALFLSQEDLEATHVWTANGQSAPAPEIAPSANSQPTITSKRGGKGGIPLVVEVALLFQGDDWMMETAFHQASKLSYGKLGFVEKDAPPVGLKKYSAYRYCKGENCSIYVVLAKGDGSALSFTTTSKNELDSDKLGTALDAALARIVAYRKKHLDADDAH